MLGPPFSVPAMVADGDPVKAIEDAVTFSVTFAGKFKLVKLPPFVVGMLAEATVNEPPVA